ncbi:unnamed protein product, partial [Discosporangium mesarthrocarpum]
VVLGATEANKHVATENNALVAQCLLQIQKLLLEHPGVSFAYEATNCGG